MTDNVCKYIKGRIQKGLQLRQAQVHREYTKAPIKKNSQRRAQPLHTSTSILTNQFFYR